MMDAINRLPRLLLLAMALSTAAALSQHPSNALELPCPRFPRPHYEQKAEMARWLAHQLDWGVVSTTSRHLGGVAFGNALSFADGPRCRPTGRLIFYLSPMDATMQDLEKCSNASLTLHEAQLPGACKGVDPESPLCAKLTVTGSLEPVPGDGLEEAAALMFPRHPEMRHWPKGHKFRLFELHISTVRLLDYFGGPSDMGPDEYFAAGLGSGTDAEQA